MSSRRQSRELALQVLFQREFVPNIPVRKCLDLFEQNLSAIEPGTGDYAEYLIQGVVAKESEIDNIIGASSKNWKLSRMSLVDRNVLRVAVFEALFASPLIPHPVAINEAIEIARKYGSTESPSFINGVLDSVFQK